ncbi:MAG: HD domain-containing protein [Planctomycetia bacterium]|nr:HD domain-containing protein [Planctomycetia bacterium]
MSDAHRTYEIRCPIHGFIPVNDWEWEIISQPAFQRLRRIRQLAWTDLVYPGAMHTRFEHSLGVMHVASQLYDGIAARSREVLKELGYNDDGLQRDRALVRLTALLHDVGHAPFSHASEDLLPARADGTSYSHEDYSAAIIRRQFAEVIANHPLNLNYGLKAANITSLLEGTSEARNTIFWRELINGQIDADRIDYLLRDSHHAGVDYGRFDWQRLRHTVVAVRGGPGEGPRLGISEGGWHAAEALVLARYFMFTQVYFHKTRVACDHHLRHTLHDLLSDGKFPPPNDARLEEYLAWDDWRVLGRLAEGKAGEHGIRLAQRDHYREVYHTPESPGAKDLRLFERVREKLGDLVKAEESAKKSWYKVGPADIPVVADNARCDVLPLSRFSTFVAKMKPVGKVMLYCRREDKDEALSRMEGVLSKRRSAQ